MLADVVHRELLDSRRYRLCAERACPQCRHIKVSHFACASGVGHDRFEEGRARLEQGDLVALDNGREASRMREEW